MSDYATIPLERLSITDLTDALGITESARVLNTSRRTIYTIRNTNTASLDRVHTLVKAVRRNEAECRQRLAIKRSLQAAKFMNSLPGAIQ